MYANYCWLLNDWLTEWMNENKVEKISCKHKREKKKKEEEST